VRAVVIYESALGNTRRIADAIADGISSDAMVCAVAFATRRDLDVDLLVVGGPSGRADGGDLAVGLSDWLELHSLAGVRAAAFETRPKRSTLFTPSTSKGLARRLRAAGASVIAPPTSFFVDRNDRLMVGELDRAMEFGALLAGQFTLSAAG
jgi:hypothetical protein